MLARTISALLAARAREDRDRAAIRAPGRDDLGYGALHGLALEVAAGLGERGLGRGDRVALVLGNGPEAAAAFLAVAGAATCAPLNPAYTEDELAFSFDDLGVRAVVVEAAGSSRARAAAERLSLPVLTLLPRRDGPAGTFSLAGAAAGRAVGSGAPGDDDVALVLHTSGTTARPKIVPLTQRNLCASAANIHRSLDLGRDDACLNVMPLFHIHGLMASLLATVHAGGSVVCTAGFRSGDFAAWLEALGATWYSAVPTIHQAVLQACAGRSALRSSRLRFVRSSSAALPPRVARELEALFEVPVIEAYGMTEASHQMASNPLAAGAQKPGSVGPAAGPEIAVMDESGALLERGAVGEVVIRGETVTAGYERNSEANASAFVGGWFRTGDQGVLDDDGYLFLTGRLKELINRGGEKIAPREVEDALLRHPAVAQAVAFAAPHPSLGEEVAAAVVLRDGATATPGELRRLASGQLAPFKVPRRVEIVAEIPKGATGKVQRARLAEALGLDGPASDRSRPPRSSIERRIADVWCRVLGIERIGLEDDFFDLGGDSLAAVEMLEVMAELLGWEVPVADFLERPTIAELIELRDRAATEPAASDRDPVPLRSGGSEPPIFCTPLHDGSLWRVAKLARFIPVDGPIYGFRAPPVGARGALDSIETLAERNLAALARVQPDGPVRLVGPCFGGTVALEMAIRLTRRGRPVELLAMLNSFNRAWRRTTSVGSAAPPRGWRARHLIERVRFHRERLARLGRAERIAYLRVRADLARVHWTDEARRLLFEVTTRAGLPRPPAVQRVAYASRRAQRLYEPRPYAGPVLMVRALAPIAGVYPLPLLGWADALRGDVELLDLPCEQLELWTDDRVLQQVAARIGEVLASARRSAA
jgi:acyl-CoA synthetase (AMP-forming)/AMP-acid ligase II/thioesterase domain-containing protein/acyl carrier protein